MEWYTIGILAFLGFIIAALIGIPIVYSLGGVAIITATFLWRDGFFVFAAVPFGKMYNFDIIALPLFIFMAEIITASGAAHGAFDAIRKWSSKLPGGLAIASTLSCAVFAAISGASTATTATIGKLAIPEMLRYKYDKRLTTGCIAAGGALGVLIPPSVLFIIYGVLAEVSIGKLFIGGVIPGLILLGLFLVYVLIRCSLNPKLAPLPPQFTWKERLQAAPKIFPLIILIVSILVILYFGIATPSEIAAVAALFALVVAACYRKLNWNVLREAFSGTIRITAFVGWILIAAVAFGVILTHEHVPQNLASLLAGLPIPTIGVIIIINIFLILMGCIMDPAAIIMIFVPIFLPVIEAMGLDPIWFGVVFVVNMELAEITPPLGLNLFIVRSVVPPEITTGDIIRGAVPFMLRDMVALALVIVFPSLALWLPGQMYG